MDTKILKEIGLTDTEIKIYLALLALGATSAGKIVEDTGIGISKEYIKKLFTPFFQIDSSYSRKYRGSGLGLVICKAIVEQHNGKIWVESKLAKGSTFYFTLPIKKQ